MQLVDANGVEITPWFIETAVITPDQAGFHRLSGLAMRNKLYFATAPGNTTLYRYCGEKERDCQPASGCIEPLRGRGTVFK